MYSDLRKQQIILLEFTVFNVSMLRMADVRANLDDRNVQNDKLLFSQYRACQRVQRALLNLFNICFGVQ